MKDPTILMDAVKVGTAAAAGSEGVSPGEAPEITALVERAKRGDAEAFDGLMLLFERRVIALGMQLGLSRDDALDACQDAFLKVFRYMARFRSGEVFYKWLYRIAIHAVYDQQRHARQPGVISVEELDDVTRGRWRDAGRSPQDEAVASDLTSKLLGHLGNLSRQERIVFVLRDLQQISTDEIGAIMRISSVTVRRHCMLARRKLRGVLFPKGN